MQCNAAYAMYCVLVQIAYNAISIHMCMEDTIFQCRTPCHAGDTTRDTLLHQHALAALQKLSLCRSAQVKIIQLGMLPWLVQLLSNTDTLSEHSLEYSMAMLMNLCLRSAGRVACQALPVLDVLDALIQVCSATAA
jgi:hypothetical protein